MTLIRELRLPGIEILRFSSLSMERELENNTNSVIPFFSLNLGVMIAFCIITCMMTDWVKSKPVLGKGPFNNYVDKMRRGGGQKMAKFCPRSC